MRKTIDNLGLKWGLVFCILSCAQCCQPEQEISGPSNDTSTDSDADSDTDTDSDIDSDGDTDSSDQGCDKMDILFVIDNSGSMGCEQETLTQAFPGFIEVLDQYNNANAETLSYRIGVTTTGRTVSGNFLVTLPGFPPQSIPFGANGEDGELMTPIGQSDPWLDSSMGDMTSAFEEMAEVGTGGSTYEMPLECIYLALEKTDGGANQGFLRENALFAVVLITDEDDCSTKESQLVDIPDDTCMSHEGDPVFANYHIEPLQFYKDALDARFGSDNRYVFVTIAGQTSCESSAVNCADDSAYAGAKEAVRLKDFTHNYIGTGDGNNGVFSDLCTANLPDALQEALDKMEVACDEFIIE